MDHQFWLAWWFYVGLATTIAVVFVEPYFLRPQDAMVNAAASAGAWAAANRGHTPLLWGIFLAFVVSIFVSALIAALTPEDASSPAMRIKALAKQYASRFGRAVVIAGLALSLEVLRLAIERNSANAQFAIGTLILIVALGPDWHRILSVLVNSGSATTTMLAALGPRLILVQGSVPGERVGLGLKLKGPCGEGAGWIVALLPHPDGRRYEVALDRDGYRVFEKLPAEIEVTVDSDAQPAVGVAGPGTTDLQLAFTPLREVGVGDPVVIDQPDATLIYQVSRLELRRESWNASSAAIPHCEALQVGRQEHGRLRRHPHLPQAHELVLQPDALVQITPEGFTRIGVMKGTAIEIGVNTSAPDTGHFAVLGMSGMGKTAVALRLCRILSNTCCVVALRHDGRVPDSAWCVIRTS